MSSGLWELMGNLLRHEAFFHVGSLWGGFLAFSAAFGIGWRARLFKRRFRLKRCAVASFFTRMPVLLARSVTRFGLKTTPVALAIAAVKFPIEALGRWRN
jgi:hypothetical protein